MSEQQDQISMRLGEISGELRAIIRQNNSMSSTVLETQRMVQSIATDLASVRATQVSMAENMSSLNERVEKVEDRVTRIEVVAAKHAAGFGALAAAGTALIAEMLRQYLGR